LAAPLAKVQFKNPYKYKRDKETFLAPEGLYTGQFVYCGAKASLSIGNVIPVGTMPEGTIICNVEEKVGDRGSMARASGKYSTVIGQSEKGTQIKLPSGKKRSSPHNAEPPLESLPEEVVSKNPFLKQEEPTTNTKPNVTNGLKSEVSP